MAKPCCEGAPSTWNDSSAPFLNSRSLTPSEPPECRFWTPALIETVPANGAVHCTTASSGWRCSASDCCAAFSAALDDVSAETSPEMDWTGVNSIEFGCVQEA